MTAITPQSNVYARREGIEGSQLEDDLPEEGFKTATSAIQEAGFGLVVSIR